MKDPVANFWGNIEYAFDQGKFKNILEDLVTKALELDMDQVRAEIAAQYGVEVVAQAADMAAPGARATDEAVRRIAGAEQGAVHAERELLQTIEDAQRAETSLSAALTVRRALHSRGECSDAELAESLHNMGRVHIIRADLDAAEAAYREAIELRTRGYGTRDTRTLLSHRHLASCLRRQGRLADALAPSLNHLRLGWLRSYGLRFVIGTVALYNMITL